MFHNLLISVTQCVTQSTVPFWRRGWRSFTRLCKRVDIFHHTEDVAFRHTTFLGKECLITFEKICASFQVMVLHEDLRVKRCFGRKLRTILLSSQPFEPPGKVSLGELFFVARELYPRRSRSSSQRAMYRVHISRGVDRSFIIITRLHDAPPSAITMMLQTKKLESFPYLFMANSILDVVSKYSNANVPPKYVELYFLC